MITFLLNFFYYFFLSTISIGILLIFAFLILDYQSLKNLSKYNKNYKFVIVGSGFSGLVTGIKLKKMGLTNFKIFESSEELGGTWTKNVYPGCECDVK